MNLCETVAKLEPKEIDLSYLGGICDVWGSIKIEGRNTKCPYPSIIFKSPFRDTLEAIQEASGGLGNLSAKAIAPSTNQVRPQYVLRYSGSHYYLFENMVVPYMRIGKRVEWFWKNRHLLNELRSQIGLTSPFRLPNNSEQATLLSS
jgi:hypothetical protein